MSHQEARNALIKAKHDIQAEIGQVENDIEIAHDVVTRKSLYRRSLLSKLDSLTESIAFLEAEDA